MKNTVNAKKTYDSLDITKWICALLVVSIHTSPLEPYSDVAHFYVENVLARIAVPLFFTISGFLFFKSVQFENGRIARNHYNLSRLLHTVKRLSLIYLCTAIFFLLYQIPYWYSIGWWGITALKDYLFSFFLSGASYHLWYLLASIYGIILFYILLSFFSMNHMQYICTVFWLVECLLYSYSWIGVDNINLLNWLTAHFPICFDAIFRAIPLMMVGLLCLRSSRKKKPIIYMIVTGVSFLGLAAEASVLHFCTPNTQRYSFLLLTPVFSYFALQYLLSVNIQFKNRKIPPLLRSSSTLIYCIHPMIVYILTFMGIRENISKWLCTSIISVLLGLLIAHVLIVFKRSKQP